MNGYTVTSRPIYYLLLDSLKMHDEWGISKEREERERKVDGGL